MFLSRTKLCVFNFHNCCRNDEHACNFAHCLDRLLMPEESLGNWSEAFRRGDVDINFWPDYWPNPDSRSRFQAQFRWEFENQVNRIPNWAWGYALHLKIITWHHVPPHIPEDFSWPELQYQWILQLDRGLPTAYTTLSPNLGTLWRRQLGLRQAWTDSPLKGKGKGKGTVKGETGQGKGKGMGQGQKGKGNGKGMDQGEKGKGQGQCTDQGNVPPPAPVTRPNLDSADPTPSPNADVPLAPDKMQHEPNKMSISPGTQTEEEPKEKPEEVPCHEEGPPPPPPVPAGGVPSEEPTPPPPPPTEGPPLQGFQ